MEYLLLQNSSHQMLNLMVKRLLSTAFFAAIAVFAQSQTIWSEDFDGSNSLPAGWTQTTAATDGGWKIGTATDLSSQFSAPLTAAAMYSARTMMIATATSRKTSSSRRSLT